MQVVIVKRNLIDLTGIANLKRAILKSLVSR